METQNRKDELLHKESYKVSRYTFLIENAGSYYIYNVLSNALYSIDKELYCLLDKCKKNGHYCKKLDNTTFLSLIDGLFISNNDEDDFLIYKSIISSQRAQRDIINLTIAPTMDCIFRCHYCFEKNKRATYMTESVMNGIVKYIEKLEGAKIMNLTWFGGEPLMAVPQMLKMHSKLIRKRLDIKIFSNIITTGYHLDEYSIDALKKMDVHSMQITIDGTEENHNKIKKTKGCKNVFRKVMENIELLFSKNQEIQLVIRVNITKDNASDYIELQEMLYKRFYGRKISVVPAFVLDRSNCGITTKSGMFSVNECSEYILQLSHLGIESPQVRYPQNFIAECAIRNPYSISFDPEGYLYKCWEHIGNPSFAIGKIDKNGNITNFNSLIFNRQMFGSDQLEDPQCRKCQYLPLCNGGCPIQRIENEFHQGNNNQCIYYKDHMEEFIKEHIRKNEMQHKKLQ